MDKREKKQSKLGRLLTERGLTQAQFAEMVYERTGYFINIQNVSNLCTGFRKIKKLDMAIRFAQTLDVDIKDLLDEF